MSDSVGFVVTLPGFSVENAAPENCALHSSYDTMKVKLDPNNPQFGNLTVTFTDQPASSSSFPVYTIHHGYGYIPAYYLFHSVRDSYKALTAEVGNQFALDATFDAYFLATPTIQDIIITFVTTANFVFDPSPAGQYYAFRWYIFANDGI